MKPKRNLTHIAFIVDTNCVNARQVMPEMNQLEDWASKELILLQTTEIAQNEMAAGNNAARIAKAYSFIYTMSKRTTHEETAKLQKIEDILFPNGAVTQNQKNDVEIVFNAGKYPKPLITNDGGSKSQPGGILGNKHALASIGIDVINPAEAVSKVKASLQDRDKYARQWALKNGAEVPSWVGQE